MRCFVFDAQGIRNFLLFKSLVKQELSGCVFQIEGCRTIHHHSPVIPGGAHIVFSDSHTAYHHDTAIGILFRYIIERYFAMVPGNQIRSTKNREDSPAPVWYIGRIGNVHMDFNQIMQPLLTIFLYFRLQQFWPECWPARFCWFFHQGLFHGFIGEF